MSSTPLSPRLSLPSLELDCMKTIWTLGQGTVKQVHRDLASRRPLAYTTVLTVLDRLHRKGVVRRERMGKAHLYRPAYFEEDARKDALERLVRDFFGGSEHRLANYLGNPGDRPASLDE